MLSGLKIPPSSRDYRDEFEELALIEDFLVDEKSLPHRQAKNAHRALMGNARRKF